MKPKIREIVRSMALDVLGMISKPSNGVHLLNSHLLTMNEALDADFFDHQLKILSKQSTIIPFSEAVELIHKRHKPNSSLIAFSYDDGFEECYTHIAPVLEKYNGYACFFVNPNFVDGDKEYIASFLEKKVHIPFYKKPMKWEQIFELQSRGHIIGAHTMDHIRVSELTEQEEMEYQIGECKKVIESQIGSECNLFAFTYGHPDRDFDLKSVEIAEEYYSAIFSASNWQNYFSYNERVLNRRHCEPYWKASHINYFLSKQILY